MPPCPIFDDVQTSRSKQRKKILETLLGQCVHVRGVVDNQVERILELCGLSDEVELSHLGLSPSRFNSVFYASRRFVTFKTLAILLLLQIDTDKFVASKIFKPESNAASIPHT